MAVFLDTSALAKLYHREAGSAMKERAGLISATGSEMVHRNFRNRLIDSIVTADRVLCRVAPLESLVPLDPEALSA